ncbi:hypothetical protein DFJ74DRAFT_763272 [Hyaloraphidium curvatum]|nr:hypothetical protein DFJ74DRAFT_763272 [Hyaloraphidium curvatum]
MPRPSRAVRALLAALLGLVFLASAVPPAAAQKTVTKTVRVTQCTKTVSLCPRRTTPRKRTTTKRIVTTSRVPPPAGPTVTVGPGQLYTEPAQAIPNMRPGFSMLVLPGTYYTPFDIPPDMGPFTIAGSGGGRTVFDGRGGIGSGHRLAWGKGFVHARSPGTVRDIVFRNGGGGDGEADGEAGLYAELFSAPGTLHAERCLFEANENGIFVPSGAAGFPGVGISVEVKDCDFVGNGVSGDGGSHDVYVQGAAYSETNCNHYGNPWGNNIKVRSPILSVTDGYHQNSPAGARWIDFPNGGTATILRGVYSINSSSVGGNVIGYSEESTSNGITGGMTFTNPTLYIGRLSYVNLSPGATVRFVGATVRWTADVGIGPTGGGSIQGIPLSPPAGTVFVGDPAPPPRVSGN